MRRIFMPETSCTPECAALKATTLVPLTASVGAYASQQGSLFTFIMGAWQVGWRQAVLVRSGQVKPTVKPTRLLAGWRSTAQL